MSELLGKTTVELRKMAAQRNLPGRSEMNKHELVDALEAQPTLEERVQALESRVSALETSDNIHHKLMA